MAVNKMCATCRFWDDAAEFHPTNYGQCRILPPKIIQGAVHKDAPNYFVGNWPGTGAGDWCGAWMQKDTEAE